MAHRSEIFNAISATENSQSRLRDLLEIYLVFGLLLSAIWTPIGATNTFFVLSAAVCVLFFTVRGRWAAPEMGLTQARSGASAIFLAGAACCGLTALVGIALKSVGPGYHVPRLESLAYVVWSLGQEFILQSVFFLRFESLMGPRRAVVASASLFAVAHLPSPLLTVLSLVGGMLFCVLFRRYRNLYALGLIHGALGLTIAASFPDKWLHHMRVGVGYLAIH